MSIPVSTVVDVSITLGAQFPARFGFGVMMLVTDETGVLTTSERVRTYNNLDAVADDWSGTEVEVAATAYFSQQPRPTTLKVGFRSTADTETITESLNAIQDADPEWYGLVFTKEVRDAADIEGSNGVEDAAAWCEARVKVFGNTSNDANVLESTSSTDIASVLQASNYRRTMTTYSSSPDEYPSASILGRAFTVNFSQPNSTITLKFKQMPGITSETLSQTQKATLDSKNANALIIVGASPMFAESFMASGVFFDEVHGVDWLTDAIQNNVFGYLLTRPSKVPYTDKGVAALEQQVTRALDEGVANGLLGAGETIDGIYLPNGYRVVTIPVALVPQADKEARHYPGISFTALGAGAIHSVQINGIFER